MSDEWGPWIEWGMRRETAEKKGVYVRANIIRTGEYEGPVKNDSPEAWAGVIRYRIRKPRGMVILENLLADMPRVGEVEVV